MRKQNFLHQSQNNIITTLTKVDKLHALHPSCFYHSYKKRFLHNYFVVWQYSIHIFLLSLPVTVLTSHSSRAPP